MTRAVGVLHLLLQLPLQARVRFKALGRVAQPLPDLPQQLLSPKIYAEELIFGQKLPKTNGKRPRNQDY